MAKRLDSVLVLALSYLDGHRLLLIGVCTTCCMLSLKCIQHDSWQLTK